MLYVYIFSRKILKLLKIRPKTSSGKSVIYYGSVVIILYISLVYDIYLVDTTICKTLSDCCRIYYILTPIRRKYCTIFTLLVASAVSIASTNMSFF